MPVFNDLGLYYGGASYYGSPSPYTSPSSYSSRPVTGGYSSGLFVPAPRLFPPRYAPLLPTISETTSLAPILPRRPIPARLSSPRAIVSKYLPPRPINIDTADIDVSSPRTSKPGHDRTDQSLGAITRGRTVVRLHTKKLKENPTLGLDKPNRKKTPGEKLMEKFLIKDKVEEAAKEARRKRLEEMERLEAQMKAEASLAEVTSPVNEEKANFIGGLTEADALDILLLSQEKDDAVQHEPSDQPGSIVPNSSVVDHNAEDESANAIKTNARDNVEFDKENCWLMEETPIEKSTLQRRNTVKKLRRNSQDTDTLASELETILGGNRSRRNSSDVSNDVGRSRRNSSDIGNEVGRSRRNSSDVGHDVGRSRRNSREIENDLKSRRNSSDLGRHGIRSRRSSLEVDDQSPKNVEKKGKRKKKTKQADDKSNKSSDNTPLKFKVEDVKVEESATTPLTVSKKFRYDVIVEDVEEDTRSHSKKSGNIKKGKVEISKAKKTYDDQNNKKTGKDVRQIAQKALDGSDGKATNIKPVDNPLDALKVETKEEDKKDCLYNKTNKAFQITQDKTTGKKLPRVTKPTPTTTGLNCPSSKQDTSDQRTDIKLNNLEKNSIGTPRETDVNKNTFLEIQQSKCNTQLPVGKTTLRDVEERQGMLINGSHKPPQSSELTNVKQSDAKKVVATDKTQGAIKVDELKSDERRKKEKKGGGKLQKRQADFSLATESSEEDSSGGINFWAFLNGVEDSENKIKKGAIKTEPIVPLETSNKTNVEPGIRNARSTPVLANKALSEEKATPQQPKQNRNKPLPPVKQEIPPQSKPSLTAPCKGTSGPASEAVVPISKSDVLVLKLKDENFSSEAIKAGTFMDASKQVTKKTSSSDEPQLLDASELKNNAVDGPSSKERTIQNLAQEKPIPKWKAALLAKKQAPKETDSKVESSTCKPPLDNALTTNKHDVKKDVDINNKNENMVTLTKVEESKADLECLLTNDTSGVNKQKALKAIKIPNAGSPKGSNDDSSKFISSLVEAQKNISNKSDLQGKDKPNLKPQPGKFGMKTSNLLDSKSSKPAEDIPKSMPNKQSKAENEEHKTPNKTLITAPSTKKEDESISPKPNNVHPEVPVDPIGSVVSTIVDARKNPPEVAVSPKVKLAKGKQPRKNAGGETLLSIPGQEPKNKVTKVVVSEMKPKEIATKSEVSDSSDKTKENIVILSKADQPNEILSKPIASDDDGKDRAIKSKGNFEKSKESKTKKEELATKIAKRNLNPDTQDVPKSKDKPVTKACELPVPPSKPINALGKGLKQPKKKSVDKADGQSDADNTCSQLPDISCQTKHNIPKIAEPTPSSDVSSASAPKAEIVGTISVKKEEDHEDDAEEDAAPPRASTSSDDSGFDSMSTSPPANNKGASSSEGREPGSPTPSVLANPSLDPYDDAAGTPQPSWHTPPASTIPRFRRYTVDDFQFLKVLGKGSFGKVLLAELKGTERYYAVKCLKKDVVLEDDDVECTLIERKVLALGTKHPYLCHLFCTFQTESHLLFVMEYLNGGDLMFHIQQSGRFQEPRARFYAAEIISGLRFLHKKGIVYRDLKLDNILLDFDGHVRIADFGMCKLQIFLDRTADTFCGTPDYMAPEIIKGLKYNQCVDWWSFGILLYEMLIGVSPFSGCDEDELFWSICNEKPHFPRFLSREANSILTKLLEKDAAKRLGMPEVGDVRDQPFFRNMDWDALERHELEPPFKPRVTHPLDVQYFDTTFTTEHAKLTPVEKSILQSMDQTQFQGFSYTNPNTTD